MSRTHGEGTPATRTPEWTTWGSMVNRCTNPRNHSYFRYGARGITVCLRWRTYENFLVDMGRRPSPLHSLDRIDGNRGYEPSNCRWATPIEQARNRANLQRITIDGTSRILAEWSEISGIDLRLIWGRLKLGWQPAEAVFAPVRLERPLSCQHGHPLEGPTMRWEGRSRRCKICKKAYDAAYRKRVA